MFLEEPAYRVVEQLEGAEVRRYDPYVVAEVTVAGDFEDAARRAFRRLAGYIGGANRAEEDIRMTVPVLQTPAPAERVEQTGALLQRSAADGNSHLVAFVLPARYALAAAPTPVDPQVRLRRVPARSVAARRYRGAWSESRYRQEESHLLETLAGSGWEPAASPEWARYNPPMMPSFLRRNEVLVEVRRQAGGG